MSTALPKLFLERMKKELGEDFELFLKSYDNKRYYGLRVNEIKVSCDKFLKQADREWGSEALMPVSWCHNGFYYNEELRPGKNVWHEAGFYYIQEPSAMSAAELLEAKPGEKVLDLCAAPGGKSTQIAAFMKGRGLLVLNEINPSRVKILSQNVERMGIKNALVCNEDSSSLASHFPEYFDRILCDAPCSGEGMFKKEDEAFNEWSPENVSMCAKRQYEILSNAVSMLKPGGRLVYSTCTFADAENEDVINKILEANPCMEAVTDVKIANDNFKNGKISGVWRLWPHLIKGEGHGVAVLRKKDGVSYEKTVIEKNLISWDDKKKLKEFHKWEEENLKEPLKGQYILFGSNIYKVPEVCPLLKGLKIVRAGLHVGEIKGKIFKPSHALAMALKKDEVNQSYDMTKEEAVSFLKGETLKCQKEKGWVLMCIDEVSLGFGKASNGMIKNHYPKGLRILWK